MAKAGSCRLWSIRSVAPIPARIQSSGLSSACSERMLATGDEGEKQICKARRGWHTEATQGTDERSPGEVCRRAHYPQLRLRLASSTWASRWSLSTRTLVMVARGR